MYQEINIPSTLIQGRRKQGGGALNILYGGIAFGPFPPPHPPKMIGFKK
jgi:hypothetical protein